MSSRGGIGSPSRTLLYGEGLFETFRWNGKPPVFLSRHIERMRRGAEFLGIPFPGERRIIQVTSRCVRKSGIGDAYVKISLLSCGDIGFASAPGRGELLVVVGKYVQPRAEMRCCISNFRRHSSSPLLRFKTTNYLENVVARRAAAALGFDEAIFLNERGEVAEGAASNVFWAKGDRLLTPALECGILPGITREALISIAGRCGLRVVEGRFSLRDLLSANAVFLTNSLMGISQVTAVGKTEIRGDGKLFAELRSALFRELGWSQGPSAL
ncbi:MAG: aminotransferase class IV [Candidatus Hadarchaeales archaeon]